MTRFGSNHQRPGHLEQLALASGQAAGEVLALGVEFEVRKQFLGTDRIRCLLRSPQAWDQTGEEVLALLLRRPEEHVLHDSHLGQGLGQLEGPHHAGACHLVRRHARQLASVEVPLTLIGTIEPGEEVEEGGLACTVGSDQRGDRAALQLEVLHIDGLQPTELSFDAVGDQDRVRLLRAGLVGDPRERLARGLLLLAVT